MHRLADNVKIDDTLTQSLHGKGNTCCWEFCSTSWGIILLFALEILCELTACWIICLFALSVSSFLKFFNRDVHYYLPGVCSWEFTGTEDEGTKSIPYQLQRLFLQLQVWDTLLSTTLADTFAWGRHTYEAEVFISDCVYYSSKWLNKVRKTIRCLSKCDTPVFHDVVDFVFTIIELFANSYSWCTNTFKAFLLKGSVTLG